MFSNIQAAQKIATQVGEEEMKRRQKDKGPSNKGGPTMSPKRSPIREGDKFVLTSPNKREWMKQRLSSASFINAVGSFDTEKTTSTSTSDSPAHDLSSSMRELRVGTFDPSCCPNLRVSKNNNNDTNNDKDNDNNNNEDKNDDETNLAKSQNEESIEESTKSNLSSSSSSSTAPTTTTTTTTNSTTTTTTESSSSAPENIKTKDELALEQFQSLLEAGDLSDCDIVKVLYALGKLSAKVGLYEQAIQYYQMELEQTTKLSDDHFPTVHDRNETAAKVLDNMAKVAQRGLGEAALAHKYTKAALHLRITVYRQLIQQNQRQDAEQRHDPATARRLLEAKAAVQETKRNLGRILFEEGHVNQAVQMMPQIGNVI